MDQAPKAISKTFQQLLIAGLGWGLIGTIVLFLVPSLREPGSVFISALYYFFIVVLAATLSKNIRQYSSHWIKLKDGPPSTFWGQLIGIGVFGSLFAAVLYHLLLLAGPYFGDVKDWSVFLEEMGNAFSATKISILVICALVMTVVTVNMLKEDGTA